jgi:hypothetical protein
MHVCAMAAKASVMTSLQRIVPAELAGIDATAVPTRELQTRGSMAWAHSTQQSKYSHAALAKLTAASSLRSGNGIAVKSCEDERIGSRGRKKEIAGTLQ